MSTAIHTRYTGRNITATAARGADNAFRIRWPYDHALNHAARHPAAAKALAVKMNWAGLWIVGHNGDGSIAAVRVPGSYSPAWVNRYIPGVEGEDFFYVIDERGQ